MTDIITAADRVELARQAASFIIARANEAVAARGRFSIALAGGSTPRATYQQLASPALRNLMPWAHTLVFFGDERAVAPDHPDSNFRMAREALLDNVPLGPESIHRMRGEATDLAAAAAEYADLLRERLGEPPRLDLVLLGVGDDGHTASIFPDVVDACRGPQWVTAVVSAAKGPRLTLTLPTLAAARQVVFLIAGADKREVVRRVIERPAGEPAYPSALVQPQSGALTFLLDRDAAAGLRTGR